MRPVTVIVWGLDSLGLEIVRFVANKRELRIVAAITSDKGSVGRELGELAQCSRPLGVLVSGNKERVLGQGAQIVVHAVNSSPEAAVAEVGEAIRAGHNVISTRGALWGARRKLDRLARQHGMRVLGIGRSDTLALDRLPLLLGAACAEMSRVRVSRKVDANELEKAEQQRAGIGMTAAEFHERAARGEILDRGLPETAELLAQGLGWQLSRIVQFTEPVLAKRLVRTPDFEVPPNFVLGASQNVKGYWNREEVLQIEVEVSLSVTRSVDEVWIEASPEIHAVVEGLQGAPARAAEVVNAMPALLAMAPGLLTTNELGLRRVVLKRQPARNRPVTKKRGGPSIRK